MPAGEECPKSYAYSTLPQLLLLMLVAALPLTLTGCKDGDSAAFAQNKPSLTAQGDYMPAELRSQVEMLKVALKNDPTTPTTAKARGAIVYQWINALSLTGRDPSNPEALYTVGIAMGMAGDSDPNRPLERNAKQLDQTIQEVALRESGENPLGTLTIDNPGPIVASDFTTIHLTYTVGETPVPAGGGFLISQHLLSDMKFQTEDPAADNYVSITSSNRSVKFEAQRIKRGGFYGVTRWTPEPIVFRVRNATLKPGDVVTITYGDRGKGAKGFQAPSMSADRVALPIHVDFWGNDNFVFLPLVPFEIVGGSAQGVHGFAPSVVKVGEAIEVSVRTEDWCYNRATGKVPGYNIFLNGKPYGEIAPGDNPITLLKNITFSEPGVYRFTFEEKNGAYKGVANPILVERHPTTRVYWGETHGHTEMADGQGTPEAYMTFGRDDARLDFLVHSEHDLQVDAAEWEILINNAMRFNKEGEFIAFLGYEWSTLMQMGGHHNVLFRTPDNRKLIPLQLYPTPDRLYEGLASTNNPNDVLIIPHAHEPGDWNFNDARMERLIEIMSGHGTFEWFAEEYLKRGYQVGMVGAGDDHLAHPGYAGLWNQPLGMLQPSGMAAVLASEKTSNAIFDHMRERHVYATNGERIIIKATVNNRMMGERADFSPRRVVKSHVIGTAPIETVQVIKNGKVVKEVDLVTETGTLPKLGKTRVQISFFSPSDPPEGTRRPRATRAWEGEIRVEGARLVSAMAPDFRNPRQQWLKPDLSANKAAYRTISHGFVTSVILELENATAGTQVTVTTLPSVETEGVGASVLIAEKSVRPAETVTISLGDLAGGKGRGKFERQFDLGKGIVDRLAINRLKEADTLVYDLEYVENDATGVGDYYYVRVDQRNGGLAWTSPVWIGGKASNE
jgi:hypothetical protein